MNTFQLGNFTVGSGDPFFILGPCGLEKEDFSWRMARALKESVLRQSQPDFD